ncbi:hypothetical protein [Streptomyces candidus]|uniref:Uncharacterized protein n=1 Tax=Streptomyces candidus TaxID=67283 RepID=A0A7X0LT97_9ACTN|nr:hypothetical protein [Streptomyces candidus]MBB6438796.1 hypothetical protein [Streptomyces candidus]GHH52947.1 hypothetical protein GCM10018773_53770 [Streptomyces candidus]
MTTHVPGPRRKNLVIALLSAVAVLAAAGWVVISQFNERPLWPQNVAYEAGYNRGIQVRKVDRDGTKVAEAVGGGCESWVSSAGKKADLDPHSWVRGCLDGVTDKPDNPNDA